MKLFVGLDIGTSGVKAIAVDEKGRLRDTASAPHPLSTPRPGWAEQDPADWWKATRAALRRLLRGRARGKDVAAVGLSGQMHSTVFLDQGGQVIRPALLWCDGRTTEECREITAQVGEDRLREWVSNPALEGFSLPKVLWLRRHEPAAFARLRKVLMPKDYIRYRLTGVMATEPSDASATLMYDVRNGRWSDAILGAMSVDPSLLPEVGGSTEVLGRLSAEAARATGLPAGTPVVGGGADNACGAVGVGLYAPGEAVASWGTSGTVLAPTREPLSDPGLRAHTFCHAVPGVFYLMGVMLTAGGAFAWFKRELAREWIRRKDVNLRLMDEVARIPAGAQGLTFLPYLQGERTPHRDAGARGAFVGLTLAHTRAHMGRAVLEGICFGLRDCLTIIRDLPLPVSTLLLTGGGAQTPLVRRLQAEVYGLPVTTVDKEEGPAFGAALLAAVGAGAFADVAAACRATLKRKAPLHPAPKAHAAYDAPYARYRALYPAVSSHGIAPAASVA